MNAANPRTIHRNLIVRISVTGFIIAVLFGFGAWQYNKSGIKQELFIAS